MNTKRNVKHLLAATAACIIWVYVAPAILAYVGGVWDSEGVVQRLPNDLALKAQKEPELVQAVGFVEDRSLHIFFITYMALVVLALSFSQEVARSKWRSYAKWTSVLYVAYQWPHYVRALVDFGDTRKIYSSFHADVYLPSFILQDLRLLGFVGLLAVILHSAMANEEPQESGDTFERLLNASGNAAHELTLWHFRSFVLAVAFIPLTYFYWRNIMVRGAVNFVPSAIMIHAIWLLVWYSITARLLADWRNWRRARKDQLQMIAELPAPEVEGRLLVLDRTDPTSDLKILGTVIFAAVAFASPILAPLFSTK